MLILTRKQVIKAGIVIALVLAFTIVGALPITQTVTERLPEFARALIIGVAGTAEAADADYVCDGTADDVQINQAITDLPSGGGRVILLAGTYNIVASIEIPDNVSLEGLGPGTIIKVTGSVTSSFDIIVNSDTSGGNDHISVSNLKIDGNKGSVGNYYHNGIHFVKVGSGSGDSGVMGFQIRNIWVENLKRYSSTDGEGIYLDQSRWGSITQSHIRNTEHHGILVENSSDIVIDGNTIQDADGGDSIILNTSTNTVISANSIEQSVDGIFLTNSSNDNTIVDNAISGSSDHNIHIQTSHRNVVDGNICKDATDWGIYLLGPADYNVISNNEVYGAGRDGIFILGSHNIVSGNIILASNQNDGSYSGITLTTADYNLVSSNLIRKGSETYNPAYGIDITNAASDGNVIEGNNLYDSGATGDLNDSGTNTRKRDNISNAGAWLADN